MQHVAAPYGIPTPPASPLSFDHAGFPTQQPHNVAAQQPHRQARYPPVSPEDRIGAFLGGSLQLTGILGTGAYGVVYLAVDIKTHIQYAVKALSKFNPDGTPLDRRQVDFQTREIRLHYLASAHPNVVSMLKIIDDPDCIYVILEYCPEGDLFFNITERGLYVGKDEQVKRIFLQILEAVEHCHSLGIYHRDLKPENILVTDHGETVKLADFGLATAAERSEDYGCGSTFYMSPECLDHTSRRPYYYCAPNDVWSLGVILVNLACGRNPWKQASIDDSTYRAYTRNAGFLKTILPLSDELDDILGRIFTPNSDQRITLGELKARILACSRFTEQPAVAAPLAMASPPTSSEPTEYVYNNNNDDESYEDANVDYDFNQPLSPAASDSSSLSSLSDEDSVFSADDGSLTASSSCSSVEELEDAVVDDDDDLLHELPEATTPPPTHPDGPFAIYEAEDTGMVSYPQEYAQFPAPLPEPVIHQPIPIHAPAPAPRGPAAMVQMPLPSCMPVKLYFPSVWEWVGRYAQPLPIPSCHQHHAVPFHHQVPIFALPLQGCY